MSAPRGGRSESGRALGGRRTAAAAAARSGYQVPERRDDDGRAREQFDEQSVVEAVAAGTRVVDRAQHADPLEESGDVVARRWIAQHEFAQRRDQHRQFEAVAVDLAHDAAFAVDDRRLRQVVEPAAGRRPLESQFAGQRVERFGGGCREGPVRVAHTLLPRELAHRGRRIERQVEADRQHVEAVVAHGGACGLDRVGEERRGHRADLEAARVDERDDQRLAAKPGGSDRATVGSGQRVFAQRAADRLLAGREGTARVEARSRGQPLSLDHRPADQEHEAEKCGDQQASRVLGVERRVRHGRSDRRSRRRSGTRAG